MDTVNVWAPIILNSKNYCAVLASRDNRILLSIATANDWCIYQTVIEQAFLHGVLDDVELYIDLPVLYPCAADQVLKLSMDCTKRPKSLRMR